MERSDRGARPSATAGSAARGLFWSTRCTWVVSDDFLQYVEKRLALARLGQRQPRLQVSDVRRMTRLKVRAEPCGLGVMAEAFCETYSVD